MLQCLFRDATWSNNLLLVEVLTNSAKEISTSITLCGKSVFFLHNLVNKLLPLNPNFKKLNILMAFANYVAMKWKF